MIRKFGIIFSMLHVALNCLANNVVIDSLKNQLEIETNLKTITEIHNSLAWELRKSDFNQALNHANTAINISDSIDYKTGKAAAHLRKAAILQNMGILDSAIIQFNKSLNIYKLLKNENKVGSCNYNLGLAYELKSDYNTSINYLLKALDIYKKINNVAMLARTSYNIGVIYEQAGNHQQSINYLNQSLKIEIERENKTGISRCYIWMGNVYESWGDYSNALHYYKKAKETFEHLNDEEGIAFCLNNMGNIYKSWSEYEKAIAFFYEAIEHVKLINDSATICGTQLNIGDIYILQGNFISAVEIFNNSLTIAENLNNKSLLSLCMLRLGQLHENWGNYEIAFAHYHNSLQIEQELNDKHKTAKCYNNIGNVHLKLGDFKKASEYYQNAMAIFKELEEKPGIADTYQRLGNIYGETNELKKAVYYFTKAININTQIADKSSIADCFHAIGNIRIKQMQPDSALHAFKISADFYQIIEEKTSLAKNYISIGDTYLLMKHFTHAIENYEKGLEIAQKLGLKETVKLASHGLSECYENLGSFNKALSYHKLYKTLSDSLYNIDSRLKISQIESKYELDKKEQKILLQKSQMFQKDTELKQRKILNYSLVISIALIVSFLFFVIKAYLRKRRDNELILIQKKDISEQKEALEQNKVEMLTQNENLLQQNEEILTQRDEIEEQQKKLILTNNEINSSITYAERIQTSILPQSDLLNDLFSEHFIYYKPRNIVSGDFYWFRKVKHHIVIAAVDCTGHGVPGAFMSMLGISFLNEIVSKSRFDSTDIILNRLRGKVKRTLKQKNTIGESMDGMDISLCSINTETKVLQFSGAHNSAYIVRNKELTILKADPQPIAVYYKEKPFIKQEIQLEDKDCLYLFSDGFMDQFGGKNGMKFTSAKFKSLLVENSHLPMHIQQSKLHDTFTKWKNGIDQLDDVLVLGIRI